MICTLSCWLQNNSLFANPAKFQLMFLGKNIPEDFSFSLFNQIITAKNEVELLRIIIDSKLNFSNHIKRVCKNANNKISVLLRMRNSLSIPQAKLICNASILSFFYYCPAIWMFCKKSSMDLINKTHKRALRAVSNDTSLSLQELLAIDNSCSIHQKHLQLLMTEMYETFHKINPKLLWDMFSEKHTPYNLLKPDAHSITYRTNSLHFKACFLWNSLPNYLKSCKSLSSFKIKVKEWKGDSCNCICCK